MKMVSEL